MFEMYATCPVTGQLTYAGVGSNAAERNATHEFFLNAACPSCGLKHDALAAGAWLEIPLTFPEAAAAPLAPQIETLPQRGLQSAA